MDYLRLCTVVSLLYITLSAVNGFKIFQEAIPNGDKIPHPCISGSIWHGVGHEASGGGGPRNPFGLAFYDNGKVWNRTVCMMDSDGDGKTNGQELGDPDCTWTRGSTPARTNNLSHPGICDPYDSAECRQRNSFVKCDAFECPAINEQGTIIQSVHLPKTVVPQQVTTYQCMPFEFPMDASYHMVANTPNIDNWNVMHHVVVYGCSDDADVKDNDINKTYNCFMGDRQGCNDVIAIWSLGINGFCFPPQAGLKVGLGGYKRAVIELHWNNPMKSATYTDSSGIDFYLTKETRKFDAGVLTIGETGFNIPPKESKYTVKGTCHSECTQGSLEGDIHIFSALNHMHYLGHSAVSQLVVPNTRVTYLAYDEEYEYDQPVMHTFRNPITMKPGNQLEIICNFNSSSRNTTTRFGSATNDEMCFAFIYFFPAQNMTKRTCVSRDIFSACARYEEPINGCNFVALFNNSIPEVAQRFTDVTNRCARTTCFKECKEYIKELYAMNPCYNEKNRPHSKDITLDSHVSQVEIRDYWLRVESCNVEIMQEMTCPTIGTGGETSAATEVASTVVMTTALLVTTFSVK